MDMIAGIHGGKRILPHFAAAAKNLQAPDPFCSLMLRLSDGGKFSAWNVRQAASLSQFLD
jgi:hypothetical protein